MGAILLKGGVFGRATIKPLPLGVDKTARSAGEGCFREGAMLPVGMPSPPPSPRGTAEAEEIDAGGLNLQSYGRDTEPGSAEQLAQLLGRAM
jgi:hypothetical protein